MAWLGSRGFCHQKCHFWFVKKCKFPPKILPNIGKFVSISCSKNRKIRSQIILLFTMHCLLNLVKFLQKHYVCSGDNFSSFC